MTKRIRPNVFETNSSSTHSLVLCETNNLQEQPFNDEITKQGVVTVSGGDFGWDIETFTNVHDKLSYLYTDAMLDVCDNAKPDIKNNDKLWKLSTAVKEHTGCDVIFEIAEGYSSFDYGYIDHQSVGLCNEVWDKGVEGVKQFLFNPDSYFETDNDNH